jgi:pimeloyl-ACP methyl ester carboxylesterase
MRQRWTKKLPSKGKMKRRSAIFLATFIAATLLSLIYNAATTPHARPPAGLAYVQTGDIRTRYRQWGDGGIPVVLIHGAVESADTWSPLASALARDHRVYALDLNGAGYTEGQAPYDLDHQVDQLLAFMDALHLDRPVLIGHSAGAGTVAAVTLRAPHRIGGLMFLDGDARAPGTGGRIGLTALRVALVRPYRTTVIRLASRSDWLVRVMYSWQCGPGCPSLNTADVRAWTRPTQMPGAENAFWASLHGSLLGLPGTRLAALRSIQIPKSVVVGADDKVVSPSAAAKTARDIGAPPPTVLPRARHLTMISSVAEVAAATEELISRRAG